MRRFGIWLMFAIIFFSVSILAGGDDAYDERTLAYDKGQPTDFKRLAQDGARVEFMPVKGWERVYLVGLSFYARKYGSGYDAERTFILVAVQDAEDKVLWQKLVPLSHITDEPGWAQIEIEPQLVKDKFFIAVYPYAKEAFGVELGYTADSSAFKSYIGNPSKGFEKVQDKFDWMIRAEVRNSLYPRRTISLSEITGKGFLHYDDGTSEGFASFQRGGALVGFKKDGVTMIREIYFFGRVDGNWFEAKPTFRVFLLDNDLRITTSKPVSYSILTETPNWTVVDFPDTRITSDFYVLIEPSSRPGYSLQIGYDASTPNKSSFWGTIGRLKRLDSESLMGQGATIYNQAGEKVFEFVNRWPQEIDPRNLNWMIRVKYD